MLFSKPQKMVKNLQGVSRLIFNTAGVKSNSIILPWVIYVLFDILMLGLAGLSLLI